MSDIPLEPPTVKAPGIVPAVEDRSYLGYIADALASALAGGFLLAVWMPLAATDTIGPSGRVPWMIQAHGVARAEHEGEPDAEISAALLILVLRSELPRALCDWERG